VTAAEADRAAREAIRAAGFGEYHHHRLGYHIGIGYPPTWTERGVFSLNVGVQDQLEPGMVFHLVPAILIPGVGGLGNSETVLITDDGNEGLTGLELELFVR
jgi:Xaa-Pro dipeptidase